MHKQENVRREAEEEVASEGAALEKCGFAFGAVFLLQHDIRIIITIIAIIMVSGSHDGPNTIRISAVNSGRQDVWDTYVELRSDCDAVQDDLEDFATG